MMMMMMMRMKMKKYRITPSLQELSATCEAIYIFFVEPIFKTRFPTIELHPQPKPESSGANYEEMVGINASKCSLSFPGR